MDRKELGIAVIGAGRIGSLRANMAARHPSVRFLAIADRDRDRAGALVQKLGADLSSDDNAAVISHTQVDAVFVATPEHDHTESILHALSLGKPVFVEKPITLSLDEADAVVAAVDASGVDLRVGYSRRHDRRWMLAREQVAEGRLGDILGITARVYASRAQFAEPLKRSPGASAVTDVLTYYVDMVGWFLDGAEPVEVVARGNARIFKSWGYAADDVTWAIVTYDNGVVVNLGVCCALPAKYPTYGQAARFEVLAVDGAILLDVDNKDSLLFTDKGVPHAYVPGHNVDLLFMQSNSSGDWAMGDYWGPVANETRSWLDHLVTGSPIVHTTAREARQTLALTLAIEESAKTGRIVTLPT